MHAKKWGRWILGVTAIVVGLCWLASDNQHPARSWQTAARYQLHDRTTRFFDRASQPSTTVTRPAPQPERPPKDKAASDKS